MAAAVVEAQKHGISRRTVQIARAKLTGRTPAVTTTRQTTHIAASAVVTQTPAVTAPAVRVVQAPPRSMQVLADAFSKDKAPRLADDELAVHRETAGLTAVDDLASTIEAIIKLFPASSRFRTPKADCQRCASALRRWLKTERSAAERRRATRRTTH